MGYLKIKRGDEAAALPEFIALGTGLVKASPEVAAEAGRRAAALLHKTGKYEQALDLYTQLAVEAPTPEAKLDAQLQLAGILLEIGKGDYGKIENTEVRNSWYQLSMDACREIADTPGVPPETQAIAELMYLEGYYFQKDFATARDLGIAYLEKWEPWLKANPPKSSKEWNAARQIVTAETWLCFCYYRLGQYDECIATAQSIRSGKWKESDPYPVFNSFAFSMIYEAFANEKQGKAEAGAKLRDEVKAKYSAWSAGEIERAEVRVGLREAQQ